MFSFFKKKPAPKIDLYSLEYQYNELLQMSRDCPDQTKVAETADFEIRFIDYGVRYDSYTNEEIPMERIIYTSKEPIVSSPDASPQIQYGVLHIQDEYQMIERYSSSNHLPEQVKQNLISHGYSVW